MKNLRTTRTTTRTTTPRCSPQSRIIGRCQGGFPGGGFSGSGIPDIEDLINDFFGQGRRGGGRSRSSSEPTRYKGRDLRYEVVLDFNEAVIGTKKNVAIRRAKTYKTCNACNGAGEVNYSQGFFSNRYCNVKFLVL